METIDELIEGAEQFAAHQAQRRHELESELALTNVQIAATEEAIAALRGDGQLGSPRVEAQEPPASPPPSEPAAPNSAGAKEPPAPEDSPPPSGTLLDDDVREVIRKDGPEISRSGIVHGLGRRGRPEASEYTLTRMIARLLAEGRIVASGKGSGTRYSVRETVTPATPPATPGKLGEDLGAGPHTPEPERNGKPTLEGCILAFCAVPRSRSDLEHHVAEELGEEGYSHLNSALGRLFREQEIRMRTEGGVKRMVAAP